MTLALVAAVYGVVAALVFRRFTDARRIRAATNRLLAHVMEFRLFVDEPGLIWQAQKAALRANFELLRLVAVPALAMAAIFAVLWTPMDRYFGHGPLPAGESTVMTSHSDRVPAVAGIVVETPGVRIPRTGEVSWRIRPSRPVSAGFPPGVEVRYPRNPAWLWWFFGVSTLSAAVVGIWEGIRPTNKTA
jgi:hypothetical protein